MGKRLSRLFRWLYKGIPEIKITPSISLLSDKTKLNGKRVLIIGGTHGVGFQIALKCRECGAQIAIVGRNPEALTEASKRLGNCVSIPFDITSTCNYKDLFSTITKSLGGISDSLIFCASLYLHENSIEEVTEEGFDRQFYTNVKAPYFLAKEFLEMIKRQGIPAANILFISSEMGLYGSELPYGLGKASLNSLVEGLSHQNISCGIRINALAPGTMSNERASGDNPDIFNKYSCGKRFILAEEVAEVAAFMLSDASSCISGAIIPCDLGNHLR